MCSNEPKRNYCHPFLGDWYDTKIVTFPVILYLSKKRWHHYSTNKTLWYLMVKKNHDFVLMDCVGWCTWENGSEPERKWCDNTDFDGWGPARLTQKVTQLITNHRKAEIWLISAPVIDCFILILIKRMAHHPDESPLMEISYRNVPVRQNVRQNLIPLFGQKVPQKCQKLHNGFYGKEGGAG